MKFRQNSRALRRKALSALTCAFEAFDSPHDEGRHTRVLLHLQHAFEMLLKAVLVQAGTEVFDKVTGRSIGFRKCLALVRSSSTISLGDDDAGTLLTINAMRDEEQHWFAIVPEQILYLYARAAVTLFEELSTKAFGDRLADHLPARVLPLSVEPPRDLALLLDDEYSQIAVLLQPGRRARHEVGARIRTLLAMGAHTEPDVSVSVKDVARVENAIRRGGQRAEVLPKLEGLTTSVDGEGLVVTVHVTKSRGAPMRYVADEAEPAAAIRQVDLSVKYHRSASALARDTGLTGPRSLALRRHLGIDVEGPFSHLFQINATRTRMFSDHAFTTMRDAVASLDLDAVWAAHKPPRKGTPRIECAESGCRATGSGQGST
ncbi:hypothetical protein [Actinosynnema sp. NPDC020468]|uniref:hypothetical protein n=1 Tax=Actinosynnema sp. NPDC020468 TaxID=3154488 RepID=UPI00340220EB